MDLSQLRLTVKLLVVQYVLTVILTVQALAKTHQLTCVTNYRPDFVQPEHMVAIAP